MAVKHLNKSIFYRKFIGYLVIIDLKFLTYYDYYFMYQSENNLIFVKTYDDLHANEPKNERIVSISVFMLWIVKTS